MKEKELHNQNSCYLKNELKAKGITQKQMQDDLGVSQQYVSSILNNKTSIGKKMAKKLAELYGLNEAAILTGQDILVDNSTTNTESSTINTKYQIVENIDDIPNQFRNWVKPFYPEMKVGAGLELGNYNAPTKYFILVPFSEKVQFWVPVEGKSMLPRYNNNDLIGLSEIHYDGVFPGHNYVVALKSGSAHLKKVEFIKDKPDTLSLVSLNPEYDPKEFYIDKIDKFFKVKMFISNDE
ncbi:LexA family transcriptional regulator [Elizabethkingia anophelis]|nr:LexA family transcriptional regulator [Elizabethkingia anophelis]